MKTFKDSEGRPWEINLNIATVKRVRDLVNVDLLKLDEAKDGNPPLLTLLAVDIELLCNVVFACVKPKADERNVTDVQFGESLGGDAILAARSTFFDVLVDFFQSLGRTELAQAIQAQETLISNVVKRATVKVAAIDLDAMAAKAFSKIDGRLSTSTLESVELTPTLLH